jgi:ketosteroid isomerase-like protein
MHGTPQHISAPTTMILRRDDGAWKLVLFHSIPLPEHA